MKVIIVTGTPAAGKTTLAHALSEALGYAYLDGWAVIDRYGLSEGYDEARGCQVVDEGAFAHAVKDEISRQGAAGASGVVVDSHFSQDIDPSFVDICLVATVPLDVLKSRLEARTYPPEKVKENLDAEVFEICYIEAVEVGHRVRKVDCSAPLGKQALLDLCE